MNYITDISERDFQKLDIKITTYGQDPKILSAYNDLIRPLIGTCVNEADDMAAEILANPIVIAIHNPGEPYTDSHGLMRLILQGAYSDAEVHYGAFPVYNTKLTFETKVEAFKVRKSETLAIYRVHLNSAIADFFVQKRHAETYVKEDGTQGTIFYERSDADQPWVEVSRT